MPFLSADRTQIGFDNDDGHAIFALIEEGFKSGFWDSEVHEPHERARRLQDLRRRQHGDDHREREPDPDRATWPCSARTTACASIRAGSRARAARRAARTASASASSRSQAGRLLVAGRATTSAPRSRRPRRRPSRTARARSCTSRSPGRPWSPTRTSSRPSRCSRIYADAEQVPDRPLVVPVRPRAGVQRGRSRR